jgi:hypothetical protein
MLKNPIEQGSCQKPLIIYLASISKDWKINHGNLVKIYLKVRSILCIVVYSLELPSVKWGISHGLWEIHSHVQTQRMDSETQGIQVPLETRL